MLRLLLLSLLIGSGALAQTAAPTSSHAGIPTVLRFEDSISPSGLPGHWGGNHPESTKLDPAFTHDGHPALRLAREGSLADDGFTTVTTSLPVDFQGKSVELSGYLRVEDVDGYACLWLRADDASRTGLSFQNGAKETFNRTAEWRKFSVHIPLYDGSAKLVFGALLSGTGTAWVSGLELAVDGKPIEQVPAQALAKTLLDSDQEFATGSKVALQQLTDMQVESLATLGEIWGFLKYHHPAVTSGTRQWDFELFREIPVVLSARSSGERNTRLLAWIDSLGSLEPCHPCSQLPERGLALSPDIAWLSDATRFGHPLSTKLQAIYKNRPIVAKQFYLASTELGGPDFRHELSYPEIKVPDSGYQLLVLFRWWNVLEWTSPNRGLLPDLHHTLRAYVRPMALAADKHTFTLETLKLIGEAHDSHSNLWSSLDERPPVGKCQVAAALRFLSGQLVVWQSGPMTSLHRGDILTSVEGQTVANLVSERLPYYAGSNLPARLRDVAQDFTRGPCGAVALDVVRDNKPLKIAAVRSADQAPSGWRHDLGGDAFHLLSPEIAYLQLGTVKIADIGSYLKLAEGTHALIIDIRNYPSEFMPPTLGPHLVDHLTTFARFTKIKPKNPGLFFFSPESDAQIRPAEPRYTGKVVILVDEVTQSSAEYTTMALRAAPRAIVMGSHTAGADGDVSTVLLPFSMRTMISGLGVRTPELKTPQQVGIAIDREIYPTPAGIAANRDEVLEAAIRLVAPSTDETEVQRLAHR